MAKIEFETSNSRIKEGKTSYKGKYRNPIEIRITIEQGEYLRIKEWANYFKCSTDDAIRILLTNSYIEETLREALCK